MPGQSEVITMCAVGLRRSSFETAAAGVSPRSAAASQLCISARCRCWVLTRFSSREPRAGAGVAAGLRSPFFVHSFPGAFHIFLSSLDVRHCTMNLWQFSHGLSGRLAQQRSTSRGMTDSLPVIIYLLQPRGPGQIWQLVSAARPPTVSSAASAAREPTTLSSANSSCSGNRSHVTVGGIMREAAHVCRGGREHCMISVFELSRHLSGGILPICRPSLASARYQQRT